MIHDYEVKTCGRYTLFIDIYITRIKLHKFTYYISHPVVLLLCDATLSNRANVCKKKEDGKGEYGDILSKHASKGTRLMALDQNKELAESKDSCSSKEV
jgi:hypothetical protein